MADTKVGDVIHFYDKISVAIIKLSKPVNKNDTLKFKRGEEEFEQKIDSMQIEHKDLESGKKGDEVGVKVDSPAKVGTQVYLVS